MTVKELIEALNTIPNKEQKEKVIVCSHTIKDDTNPISISDIDWMEVSDGILLFLN